MSNATAVRGFVITKIDQFVSQNKPVTPEQIRSWVDAMADMAEGMEPRGHR